jgi:hypothetical protein
VAHETILWFLRGCSRLAVCGCRAVIIIGSDNASYIVTRAASLRERVGAYHHRDRICSIHNDNDLTPRAYDFGNLPAALTPPTLEPAAASGTLC